MSLLHHHDHHIPFETAPGAAGWVEHQLRDEIARLHIERRDLIDLVERQRIDGAKKDSEIHRLRHRVAHLEGIVARRRRWLW